MKRKPKPKHPVKVHVWGGISRHGATIPSPFYEARFGVEIFVELYDSTLSSPVSSYMLKRYITFYFVDFTVIVYCYYGYLLILQHI